VAVQGACVFLKGSVPIPQGKIEIFCKYLGDYIDLQITLPDQVEVQIKTPTNNTKVQVNGKHYTSDKMV
jgi:hypothetical protein